MSDSTAPLKHLEAKHEFLVGIDSDGCVFDTMEIKHKECFCPVTINHWDLQPVSKYAREIWEFVNLYSQSRGVNRFIALLKCFDLIDERRDIQARGVSAPEVRSLRDWVSSESKLGNPALEAKVQAGSDPVLRRTLDWSLAVNSQVAEIVRHCPPFPGVRAVLDRLSNAADKIVCSQTPREALRREWTEHGIHDAVSVIAGQELGTKAQHLALAMRGRYAPDHVLMIGDAPGDMEAARANGASFYPIVPGLEEESWRRLNEEALDRFFAGTYRGEYEEALVATFNRQLPATPAWT
jgi:phosphoglycolate phosphatase-like HAD superfamily hydrolase